MFTVQCRRQTKERKGEKIGRKRETETKEGEREIFLLPKPDACHDLQTKIIANNSATNGSNTIARYHILRVTFYRTSPIDVFSLREKRRRKKCTIKFYDQYSKHNFKCIIPERICANARSQYISSQVTNVQIFFF